ncbi:MAG: hypothetical protein IRF12RH_03975 [Rickettsia helvetica]|uniref:Uncharacterized protein n=1 Tax=Rickettsia helvetica TaxID=35789 RepID=A0ABM9NBL2_RICHE
MGTEISGVPLIYSLVKKIAPRATITKLKTVAKTGRLIQISDNNIGFNIFFFKNFILN